MDNTSLHRAEGQNVCVRLAALTARLSLHGPAGEHPLALMTQGGICPPVRVLGPDSLHEASLLRDVLSLQEHSAFCVKQMPVKRSPGGPGLMKTNGSGYLSRKMGPPGTLLP